MTKQKITTGPVAIADQELDHATGGIAMLLPAVQAAREEASTSDVPTEEISLNYEEIKFRY